MKAGLKTSGGTGKSFYVHERIEKLFHHFSFMDFDWLLFYWLCFYFSFFFTIFQFFIIKKIMDLFFIQTKFFFFCEWLFLTRVWEHFSCVSVYICLFAISNIKNVENGYFSFSRKNRKKEKLCSYIKQFFNYFFIYNSVTLSSFSTIRKFIQLFSSSPNIHKASERRNFFNVFAKKSEDLWVFIETHITLMFFFFLAKNMSQ